MWRIFPIFGISILDQQLVYLWIAAITRTCTATLNNAMGCDDYPCLNGTLLR
jgi:hypothetical protein